MTPPPPPRKGVFISGAASGIGLATAKRFAAEGWFVGVADIDEAGAARAVEAIGPGNGMALKLDVRDRASWKAALQAFAERTYAHLDVLVNNAGIARFGWFEEISPAETDQIVAVNINGVINGAYEALEWLKMSPGSKLINVASVAGLYGTPRLAVYSASKFAVKGLSEALDIEFERHGVKVACVMPWFIETPILDSVTQGSNASIRDVLEKQPVYSADEAAAVIWRAAHSGPLHHMVGGMARTVRWLNRLAPGAVRSQLRRQTRA